ncbi:MAG: right-handed parallel beta-helix repeat-containing protein [bacterium]
MTKEKILIIFILFASLLNAQIFVAPDGDDNNVGNINFPLKTITKAMTLALPDTVIYLRGGIYNYSITIKTTKSGLQDKPIKLWAYQNETPIIDFVEQPVSTSSRGLYISKDYWHIKGIEIRSSKDNGIYITGSNNTVEKCIIHDCCDTGLQISGGGSNNYIINCDSYKNYDSLTLGENADGFAPKLDIGPGNTFIGCRAWANSDDGWDMYEADDTVVLKNCSAFRNGYNTWGILNFQGDGNGFKLGGNYVAGAHVITNCIAFDNKAKGFDQNNNTAGITVYNNTAFRNEAKNYSFPFAPDSGNHILKNNISYLGDNVIVGSSITEANSWIGFTVTEADFLSIDTSNITTKRNEDGTIPETEFLRLRQGSPLIDAGVPVGLPYNDSAPDLGAYETDGVVSVGNNDIISNSFKLLQSYPNPFNPNTQIGFYVHSTGNVILAIFDILGKKVAELINNVYSKGYYEINWVAKDDNGNYLSSGIYFAKLEFENKFKTIKLVLQK